MKFQENPPKNFKKITSDISAELVTKGAKSYKEPRVIGDWVVWLEQRPLEGGRITALIRPFGKPELEPQELTPSPISIKSRIHGYGGGVIATSSNQNQLLITWIDGQDGCIWKQCWEGLHKNKKKSKPWLEPTEAPLRLNKPDDSAFGNGLIDVSRQLWLGIMEKDEKDFIITFSLNIKNQNPKIIHESNGFAGYLAINQKENLLAWVEWHQPYMPWDATQLWLANIQETGSLNQKTLVKGTTKNKAKKISIFQPIWSKNNELLVSDDSNGWWNLIKAELADLNDFESIKWTQPWPIKAETGMPQWIYGMSTCALANENILVSTCANSVWQLQQFQLDGKTKTIEQPFTDLSYLNAYGAKVVAIASNHNTPSGLLEIDLNAKEWHHTPANKIKVYQSSLSIAEHIWFEGFNKHPTHAWFYPPNPTKHNRTPLLVKSHSGPTSMTTNGLNLAIQFWTSRGWGVVDVNYGGSTGFGRNYRERLNKKWGEVDVFDCQAAAKALISLGKADPKLIAIEGGSAGGFTTLACLCFSDLFKVGACRYAVSDLIAMAKSTHRFEKDYLENLIGHLTDSTHIYQSRSPLLNAKKIKCPVIFFQGMKDDVVNPKHTFDMANALKANNIPVEVFTFKEEGHGFKDSSVKKQVLLLTESFFRKHLKI